MSRIKATLVVGVLLSWFPSGASAMITGGEGNKPLSDPGWPAGAAAIFNHPGRIAWWEGPPFGGGQWHAECRGDARVLNTVLLDFAKVDAAIKRVVVQDGIGRSFWLAPNREKEKLDKARMDWSFTVWQPANWERLRQMPADLRPSDTKDATPPALIEVFTAGIDWSQVVVPPGIEVIDNRLTAHGFTAADGVVLEGKVTDAATGKPIAASMKLQRVEPQPTGGYQYPQLAEAAADASGHWVLKQVRAGWSRVIVEAVGYVPRVAGYLQLDEQPRWQAFDTALALAGVVSGRVVDEAGKPLDGADVQLGNVQPSMGGRYDSPLEFKATTDADGHFRVEPVPVGTATAWATRKGYVGPGLGVKVTTPTEGVSIAMQRGASLRVTVDFTGKTRPEGYIVNLEPEGGNVVGSYGGTADIDAQNQYTFGPMPPGRYIVWGRPNPGADAEQTESVKVELKGGETTEVTVKAK